MTRSNDICDKIIHEAQSIIRHAERVKKNPGAEKDRVECGASVCKIIDQLVMLIQLNDS